MLLCIMKMLGNRAETICIFEKNCKFYISRRLHSFQRSLDFATCLNIGIKNFGNCSKPEAAELPMRGTVVGWALGYHGHTFTTEQSTRI